MSNWYALYVKPRKEKHIEVQLAERRFETFSPFILERRRWSDRIKTSQRTLFPGYVFCRFNPYGEDRLPVLTVPGVNWIVGNGRDAVPVPDSDVEALQRAVSSGLPMAEHDYLELGDAVEILTGPLAGVRGLLSHCASAAKVVLSVEILRRSVSVEVPRQDVRPLNDRRLEAVRQALSLSRAALPKVMGAGRIS